jgi:glutathione peroxidase
MSTFYDFVAQDISGRETPIADHRGKVVLVVNTASRCGFTPQYAGLEKLHRDLGARGLVVLGFPCNQFGAQEPGNAEEIASFCRLTYDVSFPMFAKIDVNGPAASPLFVWLKNEARGVFGTRRIKWNFTKFLIDRHGGVVRRFAPAARPEAIRGAVERLL